MNKTRLGLWLIIGGLALAGAGPAWAQLCADEWVERCLEQRSRGRERYCEARDYTLSAAGGALRIDARPNGGITVRPWNRNEVRVLAKVQATARSKSDAEELAADVLVSVSGREISTSGPRSSLSRRSWSVSYEVWTPANTDLRLSSTNGGLTISGISGDFDLQTTNGGITLRDVGGTIRAQTVNGGVQIVLAEGARDVGEIRASATNGGIRLTVPEGFGARIEARTTNGGISVDGPIQVQGERSRRRLDAQMGEGGPLVRLTTTNGGVSVRIAD